MEKYRTHLILDYLKKHKRSTFAELMARFGVSSATIHRDVDELASRDAVRKVRGGLVWNESDVSHIESTFQTREAANRRAKIEIARKALALVTEGDILFLDSSTTVYELAMLLKEADFQHLTIVTNSVSIIQHFRSFPPNYVLIALGGTYAPELNSILGAATLDQLSRVNVTKAFVSAFGMDAKTVTTNHERQAELIHRVLDKAARRYLLLDRSKIGRCGLYRLSARGAFDAILSEQDQT